MFDGTDLSVAFGGNAYEPPAPSPPPPLPVAAPPEIPQPPPVVSHSQPPDIQYNPPVAMYMNQHQAAAAMMPPQESFWDKIAQKRLDVLKLFILAMVVLLGISMDRIATHYLNNYVGKAFLTETQEFLVRLSYPIIVILIIWIIKALT